jgi:hypothetical protein
MRRIFTVVAMAGVLMSGAMPAYADGNDATGGISRAQTWKQPSGPVARVEAAAPKFIGGEDQYLVGRTRSSTWTQPADGMVRPATAPTIGNFFADQSG